MTYNGWYAIKPNQTNQTNNTLVEILTLCFIVLVVEGLNKDIIYMRKPNIITREKMSLTLTSHYHHRNAHTFSITYLGSVE